MTRFTTALLAFALAARSQSAGPPALTGTILDSAGGALAGATITLRAPSQQDSVTTTAGDGRFRLEARVAGAQELMVSSSGFDTRVIPVNLASGTETSIEVRLQPAKLGQSVTVSESVSSVAPEAENTGSRMNIPLMNLPQTVSVITSTVMKEQSVVTPGEALRNVAGVRLAGTYQGTYERISLRGFTQSQLASYFRDGARFAMLAMPNIASAEQVEVLKGPASILYGNVIPGGVINIVSKKPQEQPHAEFTYRPGSFGSHEGFADFTGPLSARRNLFYRMNLYGRNAGSYRDHGYNDGYVFNPSLAWRPTQTTSISADMELDRLYARADPGIPAPDGRTFESVKTVPRSQYLGNYDSTLSSLRRFYALTIRQQLPKDWSLRLAYNYSTFDRDIRYLGNTGIAADQRTVSQWIYPNAGSNGHYFGQADLLRTIHAGPVTNTILAGGDTLTMRQRFGLPPNPPIPTVDLWQPNFNRLIPLDYGSGQRHIRSRQLGGYVQDNLAFRNGLNILAGFRYTSVDDWSTNTFQTKVSPRAGVLYRPRTWVSVYGSYSESFEPVSGTDFSARAFLPSLGKQWEFGVKNRFFADRLFTTVSWYDLRRTNVLTVDPDHPNFSIQTGEQRSRGIEFEARGNVTRLWQVVAAYSYTSARITKDNRYPVGNFLPQAPRNNWNIWSTHQFTGRVRALTAGAGVFYTGSWWDSVVNRYRIPAYTTVDANLGWRLGEHYRLQFNVKNLLDRLYYTAASDLFSILPGPPRSFSGSITARF